LGDGPQNLPTLETWDNHLDGNYRCRIVGIHLPANLAGFVHGVFGLDNPRQARPHIVRCEKRSGASGARIVAYLAPFTEKGRVDALATAPNDTNIVQGNNDIIGNIGGYSAGKGWDACSGWGSPIGASLLTSFGGAAALQKQKRAPK